MSGCVERVTETRRTRWPVVLITHLSVAEEQVEHVDHRLSTHGCE